MMIMINFNNINYNKKDINKVLDTLTILYDSREQKNSHILNQLDKKGINYYKKKLEYGDYTAGIIINNNKYSFENEIVIERKGSGYIGLDELVNNMSNDRERFIKQLKRNKDNNIKLYLLVENSKWDDLFKGNYKSNMNLNSCLGSLFTFLHRYNIYINFIFKQNSANYIYKLFYYYIKEKLKG